MSISGTFNEKQGSASLPAPAQPHRNRLAPFSLRLSEDERARLTVEAGGAPLGAYMKAKLLGETIPVRMRRSGLAVEDRQALGKALALLGQSRLASNLNQLAHLAHIGALPVSPEIESELKNAVSEVRAMRCLLVTALGLKPGAEE
ncbi:hypothetical protein [Roseomonas fluvialis]|uniref:Bacterial mobilisation domain-containing protein n=1 Tax=Roseomonas fluvialis TaxID=1750527 RepID=A0ABN6P240_9PROT|nr:hypothetical protein [Roseomonas fluvialis]BDG72536.1 hypothetical protein Rmf_24650 [Roseomonas fluvialis]